LIEEMHEIMGALECGVAPRSGGVDKWLQSLPPEDSRRARRKWRKIWRRELKTSARKWPPILGVPNIPELDKFEAKRHGWHHVLREGRKVFAEKD
tara:strand:+ start:33 stop:317 length:285 start_codon:yes stop_codon:yes gene_type:complete